MQNNTNFKTNQNFNSTKAKPNFSQNKSSMRDAKTTPRKRINKTYVILNGSIAATVVFLSILILFVISQILGMNWLIILCSTFLLIAFVTVLTFQVIICVELLNKKWYLYFSLFVLGIISLFFISVAANIMLRHDLKNKNVIPTRIDGHQWDIDNPFLQEHEANKTVNNGSEEAQIVTSILEDNMKK